MRLAAQAGVQNPDAFQTVSSSDWRSKFNGTIEQSPDGATFAQNTLSVLIDASLTKAFVIVGYFDSEQRQTASTQSRSNFEIIRLPHR